LECAAHQWIVVQQDKQPVFLTRTDLLQLAPPEDQKYLEAALQPPLSKVLRKQLVVIEWNDEKGPAEHQYKSVCGMPSYASARSIVSGVLSLRAQSKKLPPLDRMRAAGAIFRHFRDQYAQQNFTQADDARRIQWIADYSTEWWAWAATGSACPLAHGLPSTVVDAHAEQIPEEEPVIRIEIE
jgi:hypothetical protein